MSALDHRGFVDQLGRKVRAVLDAIAGVLAPAPVPVPVPVRVKRR